MNKARRHRPVDIERLRPGVGINITLSVAPPGNNTAIVVQLLILSFWSPYNHKVIIWKRDWALDDAAAAARAKPSKPASASRAKSTKVAARPRTWEPWTTARSDGIPPRSRRCLWVVSLAWRGFGTTAPLPGEERIIERGVHARRTTGEGHTTSREGWPERIMGSQSGGV